MTASQTFKHLKIIVTFFVASKKLIRKVEQEINANSVTLERVALKSLVVLILHRNILISYFYFKTGNLQLESNDFCCSSDSASTNSPCKEFCAMECI